MVRQFGYGLSAEQAKMSTLTADAQKPRWTTLRRDDGSWVLRKGKELDGPYDADEIGMLLDRGKLTPDTEVRTYPTGVWMVAGFDPILGRVFQERGTTFADGETVQPYSVRDKSPFLAALLSLVIAGLGQLYNGEGGKGVGMFILGVLLWAVLLGWAVTLWSVIDAYKIASGLRRRCETVRAVWG